MHTYKIHTVSFIGLVITMGIVFGGVASLRFWLLPDHFIFTIATAIIALITLKFVNFHIATAVLSVKMDSRVIRIKTIKRSILKRQKDIIINWDSISAYQLGGNNSQWDLDYFKIVLKDGHSFKFWHDGVFAKDDFYKFREHFVKRVREHNQKEILEGKNSGLHS